MNTLYCSCPRLLAFLALGRLVASFDATEPISTGALRLLTIILIMAYINNDFIINYVTAQAFGFR